jgi:hypothetical protein
MLENIVQPDRLQLAVWYMYVACRIPNTTNTNSHYLLIDVLLQHWLYQCISLLHDMYIVWFGVKIKWEEMEMGIKHLFIVHWLYVAICTVLVINITVSTIFESAKVLFSLQQFLGGETGRLIADSCQHLKTLRLCNWLIVCDYHLIDIIGNFAKQLTALILLDARHVTDVGLLYLNNCSR